MICYINIIDPHCLFSFLQATSGILRRWWVTRRCWTTLGSSGPTWKSFKLDIQTLPRSLSPTVLYFSNIFCSPEPQQRWFRSTLIFLMYQSRGPLVPFFRLFFFSSGSILRPPVRTSWHLIIGHEPVRLDLIIDLLVSQQKTESIFTIFSDPQPDLRKT